MKKEKIEKLEAKGWKISTAADFLELLPEENAVIELRSILSKAIKQKRIESNMMQEKFVERLPSSQSRLTKIKAGDARSVNFDLLIRNLFAARVNTKGSAEIIAQI